MFVHRKYSICSSATCRNPFFIRSVFVQVWNIILTAKVSQSLFHQVCVRSVVEEGALFWCSSQSLFHQVCVRSISSGLTGLSPFSVAIPFSSGLCSFSQRVPRSSRPKDVAIPFSSGLCSFVSGAGESKPGRMSQSLFHQVCVRSRGPRGCLRRKAPSQSLFHQVCVRSIRSVWLYGWDGCRNPFFIRSVFVPVRVSQVRMAGGRNPFFIRSVFVQHPHKTYCKNDTLRRHLCRFLTLHRSTCFSPPSGIKLLSLEF